VRTLFAAAQEELFGNAEPPELRTAVKEWVDSVLAGDLARPSHYYSQPRKNFWVAEASDGRIAATVAIDTTDNPDIAELFRMVVSPAHRRKGLGRLMVQTAERWTAQQGYKTLKLYTTSHHLQAVPLYRSMGFVNTHTDDRGFITVLQFEQPLRT
jgi:GNAT superfamily N-acetyltransferase